MRQDTALGDSAPVESPVTQANADLRWWYHTLELPGGVVTSGAFDLRRLAAQVPMPASLAGKRCLDIGTADGFWAFEMERRGAAEVVALDGTDKIDWPPFVQPKELPCRANFELAHRALGSSVHYVSADVYEAAAALQDTFDFVFMGTILLHLRQPIDALAAVRQVCRGELLSVDIISLRLSTLIPHRPAAYSRITGEPTWWLANRMAHQHWIEAAGYRQLSHSKWPLRMPMGPVIRRGPRRYPGQPLETLIGRAKHRVGIPASWVLAEPRTG